MRDLYESVAAGVVNIRGVDFDVAIVDEAAFVKTPLLTEGIFPVAITKEKACVIMPTTPGPRNSYFMNLIALKTEDGKARMPLIRVLTPQPRLCKHNLRDDPKWRNRSKMTKNLYLYAGDTATMMREQFGISIDEVYRPFFPKYVYSLRTRPLYKDVAAPEIMFLSADSAYGGKCEFAIMAGYYPSRNSLVVTYMDAFHLPGGNVVMEKQRLVAAVEMIRSKFRGVPIVFLPAAHLAEHLVYHPAVLTVAEGNGQGTGLGVPATDRNSQTHRMSMMLATNSVHYSENMTTYPGEGAKPLDQLKHEFEKQLLCWEKMIDYDETDPHAKVRYKWSAKFASVCGLLLHFFPKPNRYWPEVVYANPAYTDWLATNVVPRGVMPNYQQGVQPGAAHMPRMPVARPSDQRHPQLQATLQSSNREFQAPEHNGGAQMLPASRRRPAPAPAEGAPARKTRVHPALRTAPV